MIDIIKPYRYYPKKEIETLANDILQEVQSKRKRPLYPKGFADAVADFLDLSIVWETIPNDLQGEIAAMILPTHKEIVINQNIPQLREGFGRSTIAHEIGHWLLHIDREAVGTFIEHLDNNIELPIQPFLCRSSNIQRGIEWQAQYFASCLLMPVEELKKAKNGRDLTRWKHLYAMADEFGVTISNLLNRLKDIQWIQHSNGSRQIYLGKAVPK